MKNRDISLLLNIIIDEIKGKNQWFSMEIIDFRFGDNGQAAWKWFSFKVRSLSWIRFWKVNHFWGREGSKGGRGLPFPPLVWWCRSATHPQHRPRTTAVGRSRSRCPLKGDSRWKSAIRRICGELSQNRPILVEMTWGKPFPSRIA